jgi:hypothetical protein
MFLAFQERFNATALKRSSRRHGNVSGLDLIVPNRRKVHWLSAKSRAKYMAVISHSGRDGCRRAMARHEWFFVIEFVRLDMLFGVTCELALKRSATPAKNFGAPNLFIQQHNPSQCMRHGERRLGTIRPQGG